MNDELTRLDRALQDSETRLQQVLDNSGAVVFAKDMRGRYLFVNRVFEQIAGREAAAIVGRTDDEVFPPEIATRFRYNDLRVLQEKRSIEFEEAGDFGSGLRTYLASKFPLIDSTGVAYAVCGIATDITDRKRLEDALTSAALAVSQAEGEPLYRELARYLATILGVDGAFIATLDAQQPGQMQVRAFHLDGETRENFSYDIRCTPCETVVGHGFRLYPTELAKLFPGDLDFRDLGFDSYAGHPLNDAAGQPVGLIAVVSRGCLERPAFVESVMRIFAVRVNAELARVSAGEALRASQASYREIFEASEDAIFVHDWDTGALLDVNSQACIAYGYGRDELLRVRLGDISSGVPPYTEEEGLRRLEQARRDGSARFEWHRRSKDGSLHWDEVRLKAARIGGKPRLLAFTRDISERKEAEERRERLEAQLRQAQRMEAIGRLTGGIAHDFNNLLTSILGYVTLAAERDSLLGDARASGYLAQARRSCERARDLIQQMLTFSRGRRGSARTIALAPFVREVLESLRPALPESLALSADLAQAAPPASLDPVQLEQVLVNLCLNARDAVEGVGTIRVAVRPQQAHGLVCTGCRASVDGTFVELCVEDDGHGMTPEIAERIFEPFFSTKADGKGTGMGLAMVHGIVHEHGGHVVVESAPCQGARFRVLWPAAADEAHPDGAAADASRSDRPRQRPTLSGTVLVVDDEAAVGEFMRELLETWGLNASYAPGACAALDLVTEQPARFDAVITDLSMPRMNGLQLANALRKIRADLPVILYSGYGDKVARPDLQSAGIRAVLPKPVEPAALEAVLRRIPALTR